MRARPITVSLLALASWLAVTASARADVTADKSSLSLTLAPDDTLTGDTVVNVSAGLDAGGTFCTKWGSVSIDAFAQDGLTGNSANINNSNGLCSFNPWDMTPHPIPVDLTDYDDLDGQFVFDYYAMCPSPLYAPTQVSDSLEIDATAWSTDQTDNQDVGSLHIPFTVTCLPDAQPTVGVLSTTPSSLSVSVSGSTVNGNRPVIFDLSRPDGGGCRMADRATLFAYPQGRQAGQKQAIDTSNFGGSTCEAQVRFQIDVLGDAEVLSMCASPRNFGKTLQVVRSFDADFCNGDCSNGSSNIVETHSHDYAATVTCPAMAVALHLPQLPPGVTVFRPAVQSTTLPPLLRAKTRRGYVRGTLARGGAPTRPMSITADFRYTDLAPTGCTKVGTIAAIGPAGNVLAQEEVPPTCGLNRELTFSPWSNAQLAQACGSDWDGRIKRLKETVTLKACPAGHACGPKDPGKSTPARLSAFVQCGVVDHATRLKTLAPFLRGLRPRPGQRPSVLPHRLAPRPQRP